MSSVDAGATTAEAAERVDDEGALEFALRSADTLAATLNLRRTMARVIDLAVPRLGDWAAVVLRDGGVVRRAAATRSGRVFESVAPARALDDTAARVVLAALAGPGEDMTAGRDDIAADAALAAFGTPGELDHTAPGTTVTAAPLPLQATAQAALVIVGRSAPDPDELAGFVRRSATAVSAAFGFEERATLAATLRAALLPEPLPAVDGIDLGASYRPAQETTQIGGDFYDVVALHHGWWAASLGDVCGKGVDAAVLTGRVRQSLRTAGLVSEDPVQTLQLVNDTMLAAGGDNYVTILYSLLRHGPGGIEVRLAAGGHPPPLLLRDGQVHQVRVRGTIVGMLDEVSFEPAQLVLGPGNVLLMFTDGATEARGPRGMLGVEPLAELLADCARMTAQAITERLLQRVLEHLDGGRHDDIALLAIRCRP